MEFMRHSGEPNERRTLAFSQTVLPTLLLLTACGTGGDSSQPPNTPLTIPMALVMNQDDTTMTTIRLDGNAAPVISTLSLGPVQADSIGGATFSLGEWIFVTNTATNRVATIDPISALTPILEDFLDDSGTPRIGQNPKRIYRDPSDKEVLWTMNEGADPALCSVIGPTSSVSVLHNSHIAVGGTKPHILTTTCLWGRGEQRAVFVRPTAANPAITRQDVFVSSKDTGLITLIKNDPADTTTRYSRSGFVDLCDNTRQACPLPLNANQSAPTVLMWSQATGKVYCYLSGYRTVVEIDPVALTITRTVDIAPPGNTEYQSVGITPDGRFLWLVGEDIISDPTKAIGKFAAVDLMQPVLAITALPVAGLDNIRPALFQFSPDGRRLYLTQSNSTVGLPFAAQAIALKKNRLLVFDTSVLPAAPASIADIALPAADYHGIDLWNVGPQGAGSTKTIVVTNATSGLNGTVSLIDAASSTITATIAVGKNPKQVTVYYVGLAANDNQATPVW